MMLYSLLLMEQCNTMQTIPTYVVMGFLGSGKTSAITAGIESHKISNVLLFQFEQGLQSPALSDERVHTFSIDGDSQATIESCRQALTEHTYRELWIEWNGVGSLDTFEDLFIRSPLGDMLDIKHIYYVTQPQWIETQLPYLGEIPLSQIRYGDTVIIGNTTQEQGKAYIELAPNSTWIACQDIKQWPLTKPIQEPKKRWKPYAIILTILALAYMFYAQPNWVTMTTAIVLQMIPFLLLGTGISVIVEQYASPYRIEKYLHTSPLFAYVLAIIMACTMPLCDCAVIPILRSLTRQGMAPKISLFFTMISPLLNPIVLLSTYYAFPKEPMILWGRPLLGILLAFLVSQYCGPRIYGRTDAFPPWKQLTMVKSLSKDTGFFGRLQEETLRLLPFIIIGSILSSGLQLFLPKQWLHDVSLSGSILVILAMMALAFCVSICSTADAIIARSFVSVIPLPGILAFLIFGPLLDIKNYVLLRNLFPSSFVKVYSISIILGTAMICIVFSLLGGYAL